MKKQYIIPVQKIKCVTPINMMAASPKAMKLDTDDNNAINDASDVWVKDQGAWDDEW